MFRRAAFGGCLAFLVLPLLTGCAPALSADAPPIAHVWMSRCGACHNRVEPGTRSREHLTEAFVRHRKRVSLSEDEWAQMIDYLAAKDANAPAVSSTPPAGSAGASPSAPPPSSSTEP